MSGDIKIKIHKILDNHTIIGILLLMFGSLVLMQFVIGTSIAFAVHKMAGASIVTCVPAFSSMGGLIILFLHFFGSVRNITGNFQETSS